MIPVAKGTLSGGASPLRLHVIPISNELPITPFVITNPPTERDISILKLRIRRVIVQQQIGTAETKDSREFDHHLESLPPIRLYSMYGTEILSFDVLRDDELIWISFRPLTMAKHRETMIVLAKLGAKLDVDPMMDRLGWFIPDDRTNIQSGLETLRIQESASPDMHHPSSTHSPAGDPYIGGGTATIGSTTQTNPNQHASHSLFNSHDTTTANPHYKTSKRMSNVIDASAIMPKNRMPVSLGTIVGDSSLHPIRRLPAELFVTILTFMSHDELFKASLVCQQWYKMIMEDDVVWRELCCNVYYAREVERRRRRTYTSSSLLSSNFHSLPSLAYSTNRLMSNPSSATTSSPSTSRPTQGTTVTPRRTAGGPSLGCERYEIPLDKIREVFRCRSKPPVYRRWKTYYRYYILFANSLVWDTTQCGPSIKFKNNNRTIYREDSVSYHWQSVSGSLAINVPTEEEQKQNGTFNPNNIDDIAIYEWEIEVNKFDKTISNGWWIAFGLETEDFSYRDSAPTNLVGYDCHCGFGYAAGNGDTLHCYSNAPLKFKQKYTCDPIQAWSTRPYGENDVVKARLKFCTKAYKDLIDPAGSMGATLEFFLNGEHLGQAFRNIFGKVYPVVSILTGQMITLRNVDPIAYEYFSGKVYNNGVV